MSITNATTQESLVQYPSPYKVVDGNLCMEVTEKHSTYDRKPSAVFVKKLYALIESGVVAVTHKDLSIGEDPYPKNFVGFEDEHYLFLNKDIAYRHVKVLCNEQGENFSLTSKALLKTLAEDGLIKTSQGSNTVSVRYAGKNSRYMALDKFKAEQIVNGT